MSTCSGCGTLFSCAMVDPGDGTPCWCTGLAPLQAAELASLAVTLAGATSARCLCRACLVARASDPARPFADQ